MSISITSGISDSKSTASSLKMYSQMRDIFAFMQEDVFELSSDDDSKVPGIIPCQIDLAELKKHFDSIGSSIDLDEIKDIYDNNKHLDDVFKSFDITIAQMKRDSEAYAKYLKEYRELVEKRKRIQQQKALDKLDLLKKTGKLLISGLSPEAAQLVMNESPEMMSDFRQQENYKQNIMDNKERISENVEKFYEDKSDALENLKKDILKDPAE